MTLELYMRYHAVHNPDLAETPETKIVDANDKVDVY